MEAQASGIGSLADIVRDGRLNLCVPGSQSREFYESHHPQLKGRIRVSHHQPELFDLVERGKCDGAISHDDVLLGENARGRACNFQPVGPILRHLPMLLPASPRASASLP